MSGRDGMADLMKKSAHAKNGAGRAFRLRLGVAVAALGAMFAPVQATYAETLDDAIARALTGDPSLAAARTNLDSAYASRQAAFAQFLPSITGSVSWTSNWRRDPGSSVVDPDTGTPLGAAQTTESASGGINVSQNVFTSGRLLNNYSAARHDEERAKAQYRTQEDQIVLLVVQAFAGTMYGEQAVTIRRDEVDRLAQEVEASNIRFEVGAATKTDVYQAEARLAQARSDLAAALADLASQRATYARRVGALPGTLERPTPPAVPADLETAIDAAKQNSPDIDAAEEALAAAKARTRSSYSGYFPSLTLNGSASRRGDSSRGFQGFADDKDSAALTANLSIPIWTGGRTSASTASARAAERGARYSYDDSIRASEEETSQAWARLNAAKLRAEASKAQYEAARFAAEGATLERREGLRTQLELLDQISAERNAALAVAAAERDVLTASYALLASAGQVPKPVDTVPND